MERLFDVLNRRTGAGMLRWSGDQSGATAIEYAIIAAAIATGIIAAVFSVGDVTSVVFSDVSDGFNTK